MAGPAAPADAVHARCSAYVQRRLEASDWQVLREVEIGGDRSRGWIDLVAFDPRTGTLLIIEIKTELDDIGRVERQLSWYEREAWRLARRRGWRARRTIGVVLALDSEANHRVVGHQRAALAVALPGRATALRAITTHDSVPSLARYLAFIDPRSRRANWILASGTDGRRTRPAFVDYIDAVRRLEKPDGRLGAPHSRST